MNRQRNIRSARKSPRAGRIFQGIINGVLTIWAIRDIRKLTPDQLNGDRRIWLAAAFAPPFGPIAYFVFGRKRGPQAADNQPEIAQPALDTQASS